MIYITEFSNPEGLYIIRHGDTVEFYEHQKQITSIPYKIFKSIGTAFCNNPYEIIVFNNWYLDSIYDRENRSYKIVIGRHGSEFRLILWMVTAEYIFKSFNKNNSVFSTALENISHVYRYIMGVVPRSGL